MTDKIFIAREWMDPDGVIVASGERLARQLIPVLQHGESVAVQMAGLGGLSSSYFNIILKMIVEEAGAEALDRVHFHLQSSILRNVFDSSLAAVRHQTAL